MSKIKIALLWLMIIFYLVAGFNHFYNPASYWRIIPDYMPFPHIINIAAGFFEFLFAVLLIFKSTRQIAAYGVMLMLLAFLPVHIDMLIHAPSVLGGSLVVTPLIAWIRLVVLQPMLILWAWSVRK